MAAWARGDWCEGRRRCSTRITRFSLILFFLFVLVLLLFVLCLAFCPFFFSVLVFVRCFVRVSVQTLVVRIDQLVVVVVLHLIDQIVVQCLRWRSCWRLVV